MDEIINEELDSAQEDSDKCECNDSVVNVENVPKPSRIKYKSKVCKVLNYNPKRKTLDVDFNGYGIRLNNVDINKNTESIVIHYRGEIGHPEFEYKL